MRGRVDNIRGRRVRIELRRLRKDSGQSIDHVASRVGFSTTKLSRMENGQRGLLADDVSALLGYYAAPRPLRQALLSLLRESCSPGWWDRGGTQVHADLRFWIELEEDAVGLRNYEQLLVPGLLQTPEYARAVISGYGVPLPEDQIEERVRTRIGRQDLLKRRSGFRLHVLLHETALHQRIGGAEVMRGQLHHLINAAGHSTVRLQVVPGGVGAHPGLGSGPFVLLDYASLPSLVHLENKVSSLYLEESAHIRAYSGTFDEIRAVAYEETDSIELIRALADAVPASEEVP